VALRALGLEDLGALLFVAALLAHGCFYLSIGVRSRYEWKCVGDGETCS
jgi:hypothetical protein